MLVFAGVICGLAGFAPLLFALHRVGPGTTGSIAVAGLGSVAVSFIILALSVLVAHKVAPDETVVFLVALLAAFLVCIIASAVWAFLRNRR